MLDKFKFKIFNYILVTLYLIIILESNTKGIKTKIPQITI